jgi:hypothetical protein
MFRKRFNDWLDSRSDGEFSQKRQDRRIEVEIARGRLRDEFAMAALAGTLSRRSFAEPEAAAKMAYEIADAMLLAREAGE